MISMKKLLSLAIVACLAIVAISFSSCEPPYADPDQYPVAGHTFACRNASMNVEIEFNENFTALFDRTEPTALQIPLTWDMANNKVTMKLMVGVTFGAPVNKTVPAGGVFLVGTYDPQERTLTCISPIYPEDTPLVLEYER